VVVLELELDASYDALRNLGAAGLIEAVTRIRRQPSVLLMKAGVARWQTRARLFFSGLEKGILVETGLGAEPAVKPWRREQLQH